MRHCISYIRFIPLIVYSGILFYLSHQPQLPHMELGFEWQDKIIHCTAYTIYGLCANVAWHRHPQRVRLTIIIGCLFGISDEFHQYFIPYRSADIFDWIADCLGIFLSLWLWNIAQNLWQKRRKTP